MALYRAKATFRLLGSLYLSATTKRDEYCSLDDWWLLQGTEERRQQKTGSGPRVQMLVHVLIVVLRYILSMEPNRSTGSEYNTHSVSFEDVNRTLLAWNVIRG